MPSGNLKLNTALDDVIQALEENTKRIVLLLIQLPL